ncbi:FCD domain-containing protein [Nonomuraea antimicrobica]
MSRLLGAFWEVYYQLRDALGAPDEPPADVAKRHRDIHSAVVKGDRAAAVAAVHAHFEGVRNRAARIGRHEPTDPPAHPAGEPG